MHSADKSRKKLRGSGQAPSARDRVGGGMQHSTAKPDPFDKQEQIWHPGTECVQDFHYVKFEHDEFICACFCLTKWYND